MIERAVNALRLAGVNGPYALLLGADSYSALTGGSDEGYPVLKHIQKLIDREIVWSPAVKGGVVVSTRGGDFVPRIFPITRATATKANVPVTWVAAPSPPEQSSLSAPSPDMRVLHTLPSACG